MKEFDKIIGYESIKAELEKIIDTMINSKKYKTLGAKTPCGLLLVGEPGVGKTLMAKCFVEASKRPTFTLRKNEPNGEFVKLIKKTFDKARDSAPSIIFLDDMDKFANEDAGHKNADEFVTIQTCIDDYKYEDVFVIATANDLDFVPSSLLRDGRFDKIIRVKAPNGDDANKIIKYFLESKKISKDLDYDVITRLLDGGSCATLETIVNEAAIYAASENKKEIFTNHVIRAFMSFIYREPELKTKKNSKFIKNIAIHEAGHAIVGEILEPGSVSFVTCKEYGGECGGFVSFHNDDDYFSSKDFMENRIVSLLAGKAATELVFGIYDVGAYDDTSRAINIVRRFINNYSSMGHHLFDVNSSLDSSDAEKLVFNATERNELERYYQKAKRIIANNREFLDKLANTLLEKEVLTFKDLAKIKETCNIVPVLV